MRLLYSLAMSARKLQWWKKRHFNKYGTWNDKAFLARKFFFSNFHMKTWLYNTDMQITHGTRRNSIEEGWLILKTVRRLIDLHHPHYFFLLFTIRLITFREIPPFSFSYLHIGISRLVCSLSNFSQVCLWDDVLVVTFVIHLIKT